MLSLLGGRRSSSTALAVVLRGRRPIALSAKSAQEHPLSHGSDRKGWEFEELANTTSVTAFQGSSSLLDYSSTKGAIVAFTRALSQSLVEKGIRVNAVAPGPIWTPLIEQTMPPEQVSKFGQDVPMKRAGQPDELAPTYVFLASDDGSYYSGQILNPNGGTPVGA